MGQLEQSTTFNGEQFTKLPLPAGNRQDGFTTSKRALWANHNQTKVLLVSDDVDVVLSISSPTELPLIIK